MWFHFMHIFIWYDNYFMCNSEKAVFCGHGAMYVVIIIALAHVLIGTPHHV